MRATRSLLAFGIGLLIATAPLGCAEANETPPPPYDETTGSAPGDVAPEEESRGPQVLITAERFDPDELDISAGDSVTWTNSDPVPHTVSGSGMDSPALQQGQTYTFEFKEPGEYSYQCSLHPDMTGTVVVR